MKSQNLKKPENSIAVASPPSQLTPQAKAFLHLANDSTSHQEISHMGTIQAAPQIINAAGGVFNPEKLRGLGGNRNRVLAEAKLQIDTLWKATQALEVHNNLFVVTFHINVGYVLNEVKPLFTRLADYSSWLDATFGANRREYFRHSLRLARMGETAWSYRSLGVNRLLEVDRLEKELKKSFDEILKEHFFLDTTKDLAGSLFKVRVDSIITFYRFKNAGVENITIDQAIQMVQFIHEDIPVREVKRFKKKFDEAPDKDALLDKYIMDKMYVEGTKVGRTPSGESLNKLLAELNEYFGTKDHNDAEWVKEEKELLDLSIFYQAYGHLSWLKKKLNESSNKHKKSRKKKKR